MFRRRKTSEDNISVDDKTSKQWFNEGISLSLAGNIKEAIKCYDEAIRLDDNNADYYHHKGIALFIKGLKNKTLECFNKAIDIQPNAVFYYHKALILHSRSDYESALVCYDQALSLDPKNKDYYYHKAKTLNVLGREAEADKCSKEVAKLSVKIPKSKLIKQHAVLNISFLSTDQSLDDDYNSNKLSDIHYIENDESDLLGQ